VFFICLKRTFSGNNKIWGRKKVGVTGPECSPVAAGLCVTLLIVSVAVFRQINYRSCKLCPRFTHRLFENGAYYVDLSCNSTYARASDLSNMVV